MWLSVFSPLPKEGQYPIDIFMLKTAILLSLVLLEKKKTPVKPCLCVPALDHNSACQMLIEEKQDVGSMEQPNMQPIRVSHATESLRAGCFPILQNLP